jgi:hypothetical protein
MNTPKANLRQRVGYFGAQNGIYLELDGTPFEISLVLAAKTNNEGVYGSMDWEEISR